jgi:prophage tail gpP-like protein
MSDSANGWMFQAVTVRFDGQVFDTWHSVELSESVDDMCAQVRLSVSLPGTGSGLGLTANTVLTVWAGGELLATVRSDKRRRSVGATSHDISIEGRSLGRELVDCQYSATYSGLKLGEIAKRLCALFKVPLQVLGDTTTVPEFAMQCEQPANALLNAARSANKLLYPTPDGGVVLTEPTSAAAVATLTYGREIKSYQVVDEDKLRFSEYLVKSFDYAAGGGAGAARKGGAKDEGINYFRPMHMVGDKASQSDGASGRRAELERNRRQARAHRVEIEVPGWHYLGPDGEPKAWRVNTQVRVVIAPEGLDDVLLVGDRTLKFDAQGGRTTQLVLMQREAFVGQPKVAKKRASGTGARTGASTGAAK